MDRVITFALSGVALTVSGAKRTYPKVNGRPTTTQLVLGVKGCDWLSSAGPIRARTVKRIGYWRNASHPEYPDPRDFVVDVVDEELQSRLLMALECGARITFFMGMSPCRICGEANGAGEMTDGEHTWPEGLAHYVRDHRVALPITVVDSLLRRFEELEMAEPDESWWLAETKDPTQAHPALRWLHEFDDPNHLERPHSFDFDDEVQRAGRLVAQLSGEFRWNVTTDSGTTAVQDASFLGDVSIPAAATRSKALIVVRLSNFGHLAAVALEGFGVYSGDEVAVLMEQHDRNIIERALHDNAYRLVPEDVLWRPYDGQSDSLRAGYTTSSPTWWIRYFDYL